MVIPKEKTTITAKAEKEVKDIEKQYNSSLLTAGERYNKVVDIWSHTNDQVSQAMMKQLGTEVTKTSDGKKVEHKSFNSIYMMQQILVQEALLLKLDSYLVCVD